MHHVAKTILDQLGNNKFLAMTGAKNLVGSDKSLSFRYPTSVNKHGAKTNAVYITLDPSNTYSITSMYIRGLNVKTVEVRSEVYFDTLHEAFTALTGLYTHL
jgi:hypothetical protein